VEKPLALNHKELHSIAQAREPSDRMVMPGFNRRFSPLSQAVRDFFAGRFTPLEILCRVNAGALDSSSWYLDPDEGGWRIISEGCHFVDLIQFICGCPPVEVRADVTGGHVPNAQRDNCVATLKMADGSLAALVYTDNGDPAYQKERIEVFGQGRSAVIENFQSATLWSQGRGRTIRAGREGKGHHAELAAFAEALRDGRPAPISFEEASIATAATFMIVSSILSAQGFVNGSTNGSH
jgi:polar amino acid transport system substrate-binding protein